MDIKRSLTLAITALAIAVLACNLPSQGPNTGAVLTAIAGTEQAATSTPASPATPSTPIVTVSTATNCRTGPDPSYALILVFQPGATAEVVGKYTPTNYWIIKTPTGGTCWLWGAYATVQGNVSTLAEIAPPAPPPTTVVEKPTKAPKSSATATKSVVINPNPVLVNPGIIKILSAPSAPSKLTVNTSCQYLSFPSNVLIGRTDSLSWTSVSNADGYYVYMNGGKIDTVTGTSYQVTFNLTENATTFGVAAYNSFGTSGTTGATGKCP